MEGCISRQTAIDEVKALRPFALVLDDGCELYTNYDVEYVISHLPSVPERKKGKWIKGVGENGVSTSLFCSECNLENRHWYEWNYCPNCGTDMKGEA